MGIVGAYGIYRLAKSRGEKKERERQEIEESADNCIVCDERKASCTQHGSVVFCRRCCGC